MGGSKCRPGCTGGAKHIFPPATYVNVTPVPQVAFPVTLVLAPLTRVLVPHAHGQGGIRTLDTLASMPPFQGGAFNHSATCPDSLRGGNLAAQTGGSQRGS